MSRFTVISFYTPDFAHFATDLRADCNRFGYPCHIVQIEKSRSLIDTWDCKVEFIHDAINRFGTILWLDVECRILSPIPEEWAAPLTSTFPMEKSRPISTGVLMLNRLHAPLAEVWSRHARKNNNLPDDFVLEFLLSQYDLPFNYIETEFFDQGSSAQIVRGQWKTNNTVVQHPTINRWPDPIRYSLAFNGEELSTETDEAMKLARKRKYLYWRNFGGDFKAVDELMASEEDFEHKLNDWVFHPATQQYAPVQYWSTQPELFGVKPLTYAKYKKNTANGFKENPFRVKALKRMRLSNSEKYIYPIKKQSFLKRLKALLNI